MKTFEKRKAEMLRKLYPMVWHYRVNKLRRTMSEIAISPFRAATNIFNVLIAK